jgi:phage gpG-like protein
MQKLGREIEQLLLERLQRVLDAVASEFPFAVQAFAEEHLHEGRRPGRRNTTRKLYVNTGRLVRSLVPYRPGNIYQKRVTPTSVALQYGIDLDAVPYARIHEFGGVIVPRRKRVLAWVWEGPRPQTPAEWRRARQEGRAAYALRVTIPARPYLGPALNKTIRNWLPKAVERAWQG